MSKMSGQIVMAVLTLLGCGRIVYCMFKDDGTIKITMENFYNNLRMISDIQGFHQTSSVFMIYPKNDKSLETLSLMLRLTREFSSKLVFSLAINYTELMSHRDYHQHRMVKPLYVTFLHNHGEVDAFEKLAKNYPMGYSVWLVIFSADSLKDTCEHPKSNRFELGFDTEMMVKCGMNPRINEWYALDKADALIVTELGTWEPIHQLKVPKPKELYERRNNLAGKTLRVATVRESPFIMEHEGQMSGFFAKILEELSETLNFSAPTIHKEDLYGSYDSRTKQWTGVIGRLSRNEVDLGVAEFSMTGSRLDAVDFTYPVMLSQNNIYVRQPDSSALQWSGYFRVYTFDVWIAIEGLYLMSIVIVTYIKIKINKKASAKNVTENDLLENYFGVWGLFSFQALPEFPKNAALRITYFSLLLNAFVIMSVYSACLISYLTVTAPGLPFKNLAEFAEDNSYRMIALQESSDYDLFSRSRDPTLRALFKRMIHPDFLPKTMVDGFTEACDSKVAFYTSEAVKLQISAGIPCNVAFIKSGRVDSLAITLIKQSQYTGVINYQLQKFKNVGIMQRLQSIAYTKISPSGDKFNPMNIQGIVTILAILGIGVILSIIILVFEIALSRRTSQRKPVTRSDDIKNFNLKILSSDFNFYSMKENQGIMKKF